MAHGKIFGKSTLKTSPGKNRKPEAEAEMIDMPPLVEPPESDTEKGAALHEGIGLPQKNETAPVKTEQMESAGAATSVSRMMEPASGTKMNPIPELDELILQFSNDLGNDLLSTVVATVDGLSIAGRSMNANIELTAAANFISTIFKLATKACNKIGLSDVDDNLTTTEKAYILIRSIGHGSYTWGVVVLRNSTLGFVRILMNEYTGKIWDSIPH